MMLHVLLVVVCLASMSLSATSTTLKQGRYAMMFVQRKRTVNNYAISFRCTVVAIRLDTV